MARTWDRALQVGASVGLAAALDEGEEPPQFVVVSFDGAGNLESFERWREVAERAEAAMTFFLTGTYLVPEDKRSLYRPPGRPVGDSETVFSSREDIETRIDHVREAYADGHEIGTHFNGHFCGSTGVASWSTADWLSEIRQFDDFLDNWAEHADVTDAEPLGFEAADIVGGRTPCLEGRRSELFPALVERDFRYDTSGWGYLQWPAQRADGLWDIPLQVLQLAGSGRQVLSMDYNFYEAQSGARPAPEQRHAEFREQVLDTYRNAFDAVYEGNRAPLILGNHFSPWNGGLYDDALADFVTETCTRTEVRCVSFVELVDWLEAQSAETLDELQARPIASMDY